jgi:hypothetical protein
MSLNLSSSFSAMGSAGHHIYSAGHGVGKITEHGHVLDAHGRRMGSIGHDGTMRDRSGHKIGRVDEHGKVYDRSSSHAQVFSHGSGIYDHSGHQIGSSSGGSLGGAAMLMLLNKKD